MSGRFRWPVYVFFFALLPVLSLLSANIYQMAVIAGLRAVIFVSAVAGGLFLCLGLLTRQWYRSALVIALFMLFFISYGHIYKLIVWIMGADMTDRTYTIFTAISLTLLVSFLLLIWFRVKQPERLAQNLNIISLLMLGLPLYTLFSSVANSRISAVPPTTTLDLSPAYATSNRPDIYYIVLDGYARADVLSGVFQLDNNPFLNELETWGFFVASGSHTNYISTLNSLASSLNIRYLDKVAQAERPDSKNLAPLRNMVENNEVQYIFDRLGYETITISSGFESSEARNADHYLAGTTSGINNFETLLLQQTPVGRYFVLPGRLLPNGLQYDPHRNRVRYAFDSLARTIPEMDSPKFVFAHIVTPHPPFIFGPNGEATQPVHPYTLSDASHYPGTTDEYIEGYHNQVIYINKLVLETVDQILTQSQSTPIIIIQSDHGSGAYLNWSSPDDNDCLTERAANLTAVLTPDSSPKFYDSITPVNIFRILLNHYFDIETELLPDKTFFLDPTKPYDIKEITSQVEASNACLTRG